MCNRQHECLKCSKISLCVARVCRWLAFHFCTGCLQHGLSCPDRDYETGFKRRPGRPRSY